VFAPFRLAPRSSVAGNSSFSSAALSLCFFECAACEKEEEGERKKIIYKRVVCSRLIRRNSPSKVLRARRRQKSLITSALINDILLSHFSPCMAERPHSRS
jgi:hypothetical protein